MNYESYTLENNPVAYRIIKNAFAANKVNHAYLFWAQKNYAIEFEPLFLITKLISCEGPRDPLTYPDLSVIDGSRGIITKEEVLQAIEKLQQTSLDVLGIKVLLIKNIENGNAHALNSLLKFIEAPSRNTYIIMTTNALPQVLNTVKSRSQAVSLRSGSYESLVTFLQRQGLGTSKAKIIAWLASSYDEALTMATSHDLESLVDDLLQALSITIKQKEKVVSELSHIIKKDNLSLALGVLSAFFHDIWKSESAIDLVFAKEASLVQSYLVNNFDFETALKLIGAFLVDVNYNVNFDLYKHKFLLALEACHG